MSNKCLILIAHGSEDERWRKPFENLLSELRKDIGKKRVYLSYMDIIDPSLLDTISYAIEKGMKDFLVLPLFMSDGGHVSKDIFGQVNALRKRFSGISIELLGAIGEHPKAFSVFKEIAKDYIEGK